MSKRNRNQHTARERRKKIRELGKKQGRRRPIIVRHERGTTRKQEEKQRQMVVVYQLVLTRGPGYSYEIYGWVDNIMRWCGKAKNEADDIIIKAIAYREGAKANPPVLLSAASMPDARRCRLRFDDSIKDAIQIIEKEAG